MDVPARRLYLTALLGGGLEWFRIMPAVFAIATLPALWLLARALTNDRAAHRGGDRLWPDGLGLVRIGRRRRRHAKPWRHPGDAHDVGGGARARRPGRRLRRARHPHPPHRRVLRRAWLDRALGHARCRPKDAAGSGHRPAHRRRLVRTDGRPPRPRLHPWPRRFAGHRPGQQRVHAARRDAEPAEPRLRDRVPWAWWSRCDDGGGTSSPGLRPRSWVGR